MHQVRDRDSCGCIHSNACRDVARNFIRGTCEGEEEKSEGIFCNVDERIVRSVSIYISLARVNRCLPFLVRDGDGRIEEDTSSCATVHYAGISCFLGHARVQTHLCFGYPLPCRPFLRRLQLSSDRHESILVSVFDPTAKLSGYERDSTEFLHASVLLSNNKKTTQAKTPSRSYWIVFEHESSFESIPTYVFDVLSFHVRIHLQPKPISTHRSTSLSLVEPSRTHLFVRLEHVSKFFSHARFGLDSVPGWHRSGRCSLSDVHIVGWIL